MRKIIKYTFFTMMFCTLSLTFVSCKSEDDKRKEIMQIVQNKQATDLVNDLYLGSDMDIQSLARILNAEPSSIERIRRGETYPTLGFEERIQEVTIYYLLNNQSFTKLQAELDSEYSWYDSVLNFPFHHPIIFWGGNIILLLFLAFLTLVAIFPALLELVIFLVAWICTLIFTPAAKQDYYQDTINPTIEQIY